MQAGGSGELDEGDADEQQSDPGQAGAGERPPGQAEQAELVDDQGGQLLAGDGEADGGGGSDLGRSRNTATT